MASSHPVDVSATAETGARVADDAVVDPTAQLGPRTRVWGQSQVREQATIGEDCIIGRGVYIDHGVVIGSRCKIQNGAQIFAPATLNDGVFIGPGAMLTNDVYPRAVTPDGGLKGAEDWDPVGVAVGHGASVGAGAIVIGGVTVGAWSVVAAGAVVTKDVVRHALVAGVPARRIGWVGRSGRPLVREGDQWTDGIDRYRVSETAVELIT